MKKYVRLALGGMFVFFGSVLVAGCRQEPAHDPDSMYECKDGKCYPKKSGGHASQELGK